MNYWTTCESVAWALQTIDTRQKIIEARHQRKDSRTNYKPEEGLRTEDGLLPGAELEKAELVVNHRHDHASGVSHDLQGEWLKS